MVRIFSSSPVSSDAIRQARISDLYEFLVSYHNDQFKKVGNSLSMITHNSVYIKKGVPGYMNFSTGDHGNFVDFLVKYLNYSFIDAVTSLSDIRSSTQNVSMNHFSLPDPVSIPNRVISYLRKRGLPDSLIRLLISRNILYEDKYGNAVFVNPQHDYCEIRGTGTKKFHGCRKVCPDKFWYFLPNDNPNVAYICEAAIDAVSLYLIHACKGHHSSSVYISIGGVSNQQTILRVSKRIRTIVAVDNDPAGNLCRLKNPDLDFIIPVHKDWNEDLMYL